MAGKPSDADLLPLPKIPKPKKDDPEDVAWALSTAEAMWNRAENADAIKWIRRAAEAASEAEADDRALELAKAAADLASMLVKVEGPGDAPVASAPPPPMSAERPPNTLQSQAPPPPLPPPSMRPPAPIVTGPQSRPPPAPVVASSPRAPSVAPPRGPSSVAPPRPPGSVPAPAKAPGAPAKAPTPVRAAPPQAALQKVTHSRAGERRRRSGHNLNDEARRAAHAAEIISRAGGENEVTKPHGMPIPIPKPAASRRRSRPAADELGPDPTEVIARPVMPAPAPPPASHEDEKHDTDPPPAPPPDAGTNPRLSHAEEADQWPTQSLGSEEELPGYDDQSTRIGTAPYKPSGRRPAEAAPDGLRASQAVRVIVWRGPDGVHVAPAGTTVSAITVDALLVALDPNADLTAWLKG